MLRSSTHKKTQEILKIAREAGYGFVVLIAVLPILLTFALYNLQIVNGLLGVHILSGFVWFILVLGSPIISGLDNTNYSIPGLEWSLDQMPKFAFLAFGMGGTAVVSGTLLYLSPSMTGADTGIWRAAALIAAWFIFMLGLFGPNRLHLKAHKYRNNNPEKVKRLNMLNIYIGGFEAVLITGFVIAMNFL